MCLLCLFLLAIRLSTAQDRLLREWCALATVQIFPWLLIFSLLALMIYTAQAIITTSMQLLLNSFITSFFIDDNLTCKSPHTGVELKEV
jgi:hypothetical protein